MLLAGISAEAKKVKFAVDMNGVEVNPLGVHVTGDFQVAAGVADDNWVSDASPLEQEGSSSIYSIVLDVPAFHKYEYKFLNGDQFYDAEFVPVASRIGHDFNDNRWLYVDSLNPDTTFVGAIRYAQNAPEGLFLVRFTLDLGTLDPHTSGVHLAGSFAGMAPKAFIMYSFIEGQYEVISYLPTGNYSYRYFNGSELLHAEQLQPTASCTDDLGNRTLTISQDTVLPSVCFSSCKACGDITGSTDLSLAVTTNIYPNPSKGLVTVGTNNSDDFQLSISNAQGALVQSYKGNSSLTLTLPSGLYWVSILQGTSSSSMQKLIIE